MDVNVGTNKTLPLHVAIMSRDVSLIGAVLDAGADINIKVTNSLTPSQEALPTKRPIEVPLVGMNKIVPILEYLLGRGAVIPPHFKAKCVKSSDVRGSSKCEDCARRRHRYTHAGGDTESKGGAIQEGEGVKAFKSFTARGTLIKHGSTHCNPIDASNRLSHCVGWRELED